MRIRTMEGDVMVLEELCAKVCGLMSAVLFDLSPLCGFFFPAILRGLWEVVLVRAKPPFFTVAAGVPVSRAWMCVWVCRREQGRAGQALINRTYGRQFVTCLRTVTGCQSVMGDSGGASLDAVVCLFVVEDVF